MVAEILSIYLSIYPCIDSTQYIANKYGIFAK